MGVPLSDYSSPPRTLHYPPLVVELFGPAGSGKSTLAHEIRQLGNNVFLIAPPSPRQILDAPFFLTNLTSISKYLFAVHKDGDRALTRREIAWMALLRGWPATINRVQENTNGMVLLDQGALYYITALYFFGPEYLHSLVFKNYWAEVFDEWAKTLDICFYLDASNDCLFERIDNRKKMHVMKKKSPQLVREFLDDWREAYQKVISILQTRNGKIRVEYVNTESLQISQVIDIISSKLSQFP